jgi:hypothetical protein
MERIRYWFITPLALTLIIAVQTTAVDLQGGRQSTGLLVGSSQYLSTLNSVFPAHFASLVTSQINTRTTDFGLFGSGYSFASPDPGPSRSFETPTGSGKEYLFGGGIWVGGIIGQDTLVSTSMDGWQQGQETYPTGFPLVNNSGTIRPIRSVADFALGSVCDDTIHTGASYQLDFMDGRPHIPMHITLSNRAYIWNDPRASFSVLYDLVISNVGNDTIRQGYIGLFIDADIGTAYNGAIDDIAGSITHEQIGYIVDNDGELDSLKYDRAFAIKMIRTSFAGRLNFNWWVLNGNSALDYGPMLRSNYRDYGTGGSGAPEGDRNKYHLLSAPEWDFDQVMSVQIGLYDTLWMPPQSRPFMPMLANGYDTRICVSIGPFDLFPDSSVRIQYALLTADSVHIDPRIVDFIEIAPELYTEALQLERITANGRIADSLAELLLDPVNPPANLRVVTASEDSVTLTWDDWVYDNIDGYRLYGGQIPAEAYEHEGVPPPWYEDPDPEVLATLNDNHYSIVPFGHGGGYSFAISHLVNGQATQTSYPISVLIPTPVTPPPLVDTVQYVMSGEPARLQWAPSTGGSVRQYNIYRFPDTTAAKGRYLRHYSQIASGEEIDTTTVNGTTYYYYAMTPFATVPGDQTEFLDNSPANGYLYMVTAIDSLGFETQFSKTMRVWVVYRSTKDFLVLTHGQLVGTYTYEDSIDQFYEQILAGYSYDIYSFADSLSSCHPSLPSCFDWRLLTRYRVVIVDDNLRDNVLRNWYEDEEAGFAKYLGRKGVLVYCGQFANLGSPEFTGYTIAQWYKKTDALVNRYFGVDSIYGIGTLYYKNNSTAPYVDSMLDFAYAEPTGDAPSIAFDSGSVFFPPSVTNYWPTSSPPLVAAFRQDSNTEVIYRFRANRPERSRLESEPVGLMKSSDSTITITLGFHLWYMQEQSARTLLDWIYQKADFMTETPEDHPDLPRQMVLGQNFPNPFNPSTTIAFSLPTRSTVRIDVFNILGQRVRQLLSEELAAGDHAVVWKGDNHQGDQVASGIYLYRLQSGDLTITKKMVLLR